MKSYFRPFILLSLLLVFCAGCRKNEFSLEAALPPSVNHTYEVSYYANDKRGGMEIETALNIQNGVGAVHAVTRNPSVGWIFYHNSPVPAAVFFAERGDKIEIKGESESPYTWRVGGNKVNDLLTEWRLANKTLLEQQGENYRLGREDKSAAGKVNKAVADFIDKNPESPASVILLGVYYDPKIDPREEARLIQILHESKILDKYSYLIVRQDRDFAMVPEISGERLRAQEIIVQSYHNGCDTLFVGSGKYPVAMMVTKISSPARKDMLDSLKNMIRLRKDSAELLLVDMQVGDEESNWRYMARRDSLKGVLQSISVRGLADDNLRRLGVNTLPYWLVVDKKGKILYSGSSTAEAAAKVRFLIKK